MGAGASHTANPSEVSTPAVLEGAVTECAPQRMRTTCVTDCLLGRGSYLAGTSPFTLGLRTRHLGHRAAKPRHHDEPPGHGRVRSATMTGMSTSPTIADAALVQLVTQYYRAVDSMDAAAVAGCYLPAPTTTLQFNADDPIVGVEAIQAFSSGFFGVVSGIAHSRIEVWTIPLMGDVVPMDLPAPRTDATVTVVSTAFPTFSIGTGAAATRVALPATSIFTVDRASARFASVHNTFDIGKVYAAVAGSGE